jgi:hypothetical protein
MLCQDHDGIGIATKHAGAASCDQLTPSRPDCPWSSERNRRRLPEELIEGILPLTGDTGAASWEDWKQHLPVNDGFPEIEMTQPPISWLMTISDIK